MGIEGGRFESGGNPESREGGIETGAGTGATVKTSFNREEFTGKFGRLGESALRYFDSLRDFSASGPNFARMEFAIQFMETMSQRFRQRSRERIHRDRKWMEGFLKGLEQVYTSNEPNLPQS